MATHRAARSPFLFGAQYYRAPTPEEACWGSDHIRMAKLGFNSVKYWVQWRWSHRRNDRFVFDDVLRLMDLAEKHRLAVTLNTIFDVAPHWLYEKYPDAKQVMNSGRIVQPEGLGHRQIGGSPGPCYCHPGARDEREKFLSAAVHAFKDHPALDMWDLWNEPELCFNQRTPDINTMVCYCANCTEGFRHWLRGKYQTLDQLNAVWGRCYEEWREIETPRTAHTLTDFIDWREFHLDVVTSESRLRFNTLRKIDPDHVAFLHTVPNFITIFNPVTCADDFALARDCDLYAASYNEGGRHVPFLTSPAEGKIVYNTEVHLNFGITHMHQGQLYLADVLKAFVPQIGMGVRGFQFWQFRAEVLGLESPAWGVVKPDGSDRPVTQAIEEFWRGLGPITDEIATCPAPNSEVAIWKSRKNEIFHYATHGSTQPLVDAFTPYSDALYWHNIPYRVIDSQQLIENKLGGVKVLILPSPYYLTQEEIDSIRAWVEAGGTLWSEAHLGAYNGTTGRHNRTVPGFGLADAWKLVEEDSTSSYRLRLETAQAFQGALVSDVEKALAGTETLGGPFFPITRTDGTVLWGSERCAFLSGNDLKIEGTFAGQPLCISKQIGRGKLIYNGSNLGTGAKKESAGFISFLIGMLAEAGVCSTPDIEVDAPGQVHVDELKSSAGRTFLVIANRSKEARSIQGTGGASFRGVWSGTKLILDGTRQSIPTELHEIFVEI